MIHLRGSRKAARDNGPFDKRVSQFEQMRRQIAEQSHHELQFMEGDGDATRSEVEECGICFELAS